MSDTTSTEPTVTAVAEDEEDGQRLVEDDLLVEERIDLDRIGFTEIS